MVADTTSAAGADARLDHDAFISYSRKDKEFARKLDRALKAYKPPRALDVPQRHLDVFRDEEDFTGADYHASIARHLSASRKLLLLCSPYARASRYVDDEVRRFAALRGAANIIPLLVGGLPNNETAPGQEDQAAFPAGLCETLEMPLAIEYRGFDPRRDAVTKGAFEGAWHTTLASLYDKTRSQVEQRERKRTARRRRITSTIVASIVSVLLAALVVSLFYWRQAVEQRTAAVARQLAAQAELVRNQRPDFIILSVLLATESLKRQPSLEAEMALRPQLALLPRPVLTIQDAAANAAFNPARMVFSADRKYVATASVQDVSVWELMTGRQVARMAPQYPLVGLAFSPRADYLVTGSGSDVFAKPFVAQVWHLPDGREVSRLPQHSAPPTRLAFGGNGEFLATVDKQILRLWDPASGRAVAALQQDDAIEDLAFSPDGQRIATIAAGAATVWSVPAGKKVLSLTHAKGLSAVLFSPDGALIATSADDTRMWRAGDGHEMFRVPAGGHLRFSPDGRRFTIEGRGTLGVYDATNGERLTALTQADAIEDVNFQPDAVYVATEAFNAGIARVWRGRLGERLLQRFSDDDLSRDFSAGELTRAVQEHVDFAAFSPDASHFATGDAAGRLQLWKSTAAAEVAVFGHDDLVIPLGFSQDNSRLVTAGAHIRGIWELASGRQTSRIPIEVYPDTVALSPGDGRFLLVLDADRTATVLETATGRKVVVLKEAGPDDAFAFSPDGSRLATAGRADDMARVWEIPSGRQLLKLPPLQSLDAVLFSPNGAYLATVSGDDNLVVIWNAATGQEVARITDKKGLGPFAFSPDGRYLAAGNHNGPDGLTRVWEVATGRERARVTHGGGITTLAFGPDGRYLATGGLDSPPRVWNVGDGTQAARLVRSTMVSGIYSERVIGLEFTPDERLVVASADGIVSVWDHHGWREAGRIQLKATIVAMAVSPDGRFIATGLGDGVVRVSFLSTADLIAEACARLTRNLTQDEWRQYLAVETYAPTCPNLPSAPRNEPPADGRGAKPRETR